MAETALLAGHQMMQRATGWRGLPFSPHHVLHARGLEHSTTECLYCRAGMPFCPAHVI